MTVRWERYLGRWQEAGVIDTPTADRVRAYEREHEKARGLGWPVVLAISLGVLLLGAGVLLFVAAHWDQLSPGARFGSVLALVGVFHITGAILVRRSPVLALGLHFVGTISCGAGIFLVGQIFHLQEHWPGGVMLWAVGAAVGWIVLRDWAHAGLTALLIPVWLGGEWLEMTRGSVGDEKILAASIVLTAISYLSAVLPERDSPVRRALAWIGGIVLLPGTAALVYAGSWGRGGLPLLESYWLFGWVAALGLPLFLAWWLRGRGVWMNVIAALWVALLSLVSMGFRGRGLGAAVPLWNELMTYGACALGAMGLVAWGLAESRKERVNLGVAGFALTVFAFYFSNVMDRLGRSASLIGLGLLFLLGGWFLEKARRRLVARVGGRV